MQFVYTAVCVVIEKSLNLYILIMHAKGKSIPGLGVQNMKPCLFVVVGNKQRLIF